MSTDVPTIPSEWLLAYLDEGVSPVTAEEVRARASTPTRRLPSRRNPRRNSVVLPLGFALLVAIGVIAAVFLSGGTHGASPRKAPSLGAGQMEVVYLAPESHATTEQLDKTSAVLVRRLHLLGEPRVQAKVRANQIVVTVRGTVQKFSSISSTFFAPGDLLIRPVLCAATAYTAGLSKTATPRALPNRCPDQYELTASNLDVSTNTQVAQGNVPAWPALASYSSTGSTDDEPSQPVLLPADPNIGFDGERLLLGPAQLSGLDIKSAELLFNRPVFAVGINMSPTGAQKWDLLAKQQFHAYVAFDLDGTVISAPLTLPAQTTFTSFGGKIQISGGFTKTTAETLAAYLESGSLPVRLRMEAVETVSPSVREH